MKTKNLRGNDSCNPQISTGIVLVIKFAFKCIFMPLSIIVLTLQYIYDEATEFKQASPQGQMTDRMKSATLFPLPRLPCIQLFKRLKIK